MASSTKKLLSLLSLPLLLVAFSIYISTGSHVQSPDDEEEHEAEAGALMTLTIQGVDVNFRWAPAGTFQMGSPASEPGRAAEETLHKVTLSHGFWLAETETTQELWLAVMENTPSENRGKYLPVENVSWADCQRFLNVLSWKYKSSLPDDYKFALPTEAQWEYACRAGTTTPFNCGDSLNVDNANIADTRHANSRGAAVNEATPVKSYSPNAWGLYDMHGNVWEWCADYYDEDYYASASAAIDPVGATNGRSRVLRGGSSNDDASFCRSAYRGDGAPDDQYERFGFRLVLVQVSQAEAPESAPDATDSESLVDGESEASESLVDDESEASREAGALKTLTISGVKVNFRWAPAGTFQMGSPQSEPGHGSAETLHDVTFSKGFWIAETETTQEFWHTVTAANPSRYRCSTALPVDFVTWDDCQVFLNQLNESYRSELPPGYRYAMPTEAQWEYACRAGTSTPFNFGDSLNGEQANCARDYPNKSDVGKAFYPNPTPVKRFAPNDWGLYDMHGNVAEWCADWYYEHFYTSSLAAKDPIGPFSADNRVLRGGAFGFHAADCRSATRRSMKPEKKVYDNHYGFRLVLVHDSQLNDSEDAVAEEDSANAADSAVSLEPGTLKTLTIAGVEVNFHWAPAGVFMMGRSKGERGHFNETQHEVTLTHGFWIAETETTQELWMKVMDNNPSRFRYHGSDDKQLPVEMVSWLDCRDFVNKLNGLYSDCLPSGYQFGMPTEAQWEYACRAGTTTPFNFTESMNESVGVLSNGVSALNEKQDHPNFVKSYPPNAWGLYDMHGNVEEWALDWYESDYYKSESAAKDPTGPSKVPTWARRVKRGGSWKSRAEYCRSAKREEDSPDKRSDSVGFRLVLIP